MVIYYYLTNYRSHWLFRKYMKKYSHLCPDSTWVMCNLPQKFLYATSNTLMRFKEGGILLEVRTPKQTFSIGESSKSEEVEMDGFLTTPYDGDMTENCFKAFLQN